MKKVNSIGIDIGSRFTKIVFWDSLHQQIARQIISQSGIDPLISVRNILKNNRNLISSNSPLCATGYGRKLLNSRYISEISCHAGAVKYLIPYTKTIIDIGGQDSKVIILNDDGKIIDFTMNDKCAAGTGSFLEKVADLFKIKITDVGEVALRYKENIDISTICVVFAESEIISLINNQKQFEDILMAVHTTIARKIKNMIPALTDKILSSSLQTDNENSDNIIVLTGGLANNKAMKFALEKILHQKITIPTSPSTTGALGAAIFASVNPDTYQIPEDLWNLIKN